jgi:hypothetical protein
MSKRTSLEMPRASKSRMACLLRKAGAYVATFTTLRDRLGAPIGKALEGNLSMLGLTTISFSPKTRLDGLGTETARTPFPPGTRI